MSKLPGPTPITTKMLFSDRVGLRLVQRYVMRLMAKIRMGRKKDHARQRRVHECPPPKKPQSKDTGICVRRKEMDALSWRGSLKTSVDDKGTWWSTSKSLVVLTDHNIRRARRAWRVLKMSEWDRAHPPFLCRTTAAATESAGPKLSSARPCALGRSAWHEWGKLWLDSDIPCYREREGGREKEREREKFWKAETLWHERVLLRSSYVKADARLNGTIGGSITPS